MKYIARLLAHLIFFLIRLLGTIIIVVFYVLRLIVRILWDFNITESYKEQNKLLHHTEIKHHSITRASKLYYKTVFHRVWGLKPYREHYYNPMADHTYKYDGDISIY